MIHDNVNINAFIGSISCGFVSENEKVSPENVNYLDMMQLEMLDEIIL